MKEVLVLLVVIVLFGGNLTGQNAFFKAQAFAALSPSALNQILIDGGEQQVFDIIEIPEQFKMFAIEVLIDTSKSDLNSRPEGFLEKVWNELGDKVIDLAKADKTDKDSQILKYAIKFSNSEIRQLEVVIRDIEESGGDTLKQKRIIEDWLESIGKTEQVKREGLGFSLSNAEKNYLNSLIKFWDNPWSGGEVMTLDRLGRIEDRYQKALAIRAVKDGESNSSESNFSIFNFANENSSTTPSVTSLLGSSTAASAAVPGAAFEAQLIDALGTFIAERFKEDITITYLNKFRDRMNRIPELKALLPYTWKLFETEDPFDYASLGEKWKTAFEQDLKSLALNFRDMVATAQPDSRWYRLRETKAFSWMDLGIEIGDQVTRGRHPAEMLQHIEDRYNPKLWPLRTSKMDSAVYKSTALLNLLQLNLRDTAKTATGEWDHLWIDFEDLKKLDTKEEMQFFCALVYRQNPELFDLLDIQNKQLFPFSEEFWAEKNGPVAKFELFRSRLNNMMILMKDIEEKIEALKFALKDNKGGAAEIFEDYSRSLLEWMQTFQDVYVSISGKDPMLPEYFFSIAGQSMDIYESMVEKDYHQVATNVAGMLRTLLENVEVKEGNNTAMIIALLLVERRQQIGGAMKGVDIDTRKKIMGKIPEWFVQNSIGDDGFKSELRSLLIPKPINKSDSTKKEKLIEEINKVVFELHKKFLEKLGDSKVFQLANDAVNTVSQAKEYEELFKTYKENDEWKKILKELPVFVLNPEFSKEKADSMAGLVILGSSDKDKKNKEKIVEFLQVAHHKVQAGLARIPAVGQIQLLLVSALESDKSLRQFVDTLKTDGNSLLLNLAPLLLESSLDTSKVGPVLREPRNTSSGQLLTKKQVDKLLVTLQGLHASLADIILYGQEKMTYAGDMVEQYLKKQDGVVQKLEEKLGREAEEVLNEIKAALLHEMIASIGEKDIKSIRSKIGKSLQLKEILGKYKIKTDEILKGDAFKQLKNRIAALLAEELIASHFDAKMLQELIKYFTFTVEMVNAENSDDMKRAIKQVVLPPGSYINKRTSNFNLSLTAKPGVLVGGEFGLEEDQSCAFNVGLTAPIGLDFCWGLRTKKKHRAVKSDRILTRRPASKNRKISYRYGSSFGLYVGLIDVGAVFNARLFENSDNIQSVPSDIRLVQVFSPSLFFDYGIKNSPITIGIGAQYTPQLRNLDQDEDGMAAESALEDNSIRVGARIVWDMPMLNLVNKKDRSRSYKGWLK